MIRKFLTSIILVASLATGICNAQHKVSQTSRDWSADANSIIKGEKSKLRQAELLYRWISSNISLDTSGTIGTADECWDLKSGASLGFCELYYRLAEAVGLQTYIITGVAKNQSGDIHDHVCVSDKSDIDKSELYSLGCRRYGMVIHTPGRDHPFPGVAALQESEYFIEILQHGFSFTRSEWQHTTLRSERCSLCHGQSSAPRWS